MFIKFESWRPDLAPMNAGSANTLNTIRVADGYETIPSPSKTSISGFDGVPRQLFLARTSTGVVMPLCLGSARSYRAAAIGWLVLPGSEFSSPSWAAVPWGDVVYAVNGVDPLFKIDVPNSGVFVPIDTPDGLTGRFLIAVAGFLMMIDVRKFLGSERHPYRVQWSGYLRPEIFQNQPNAIQSDYQDVQEIGELRGAVGGEYALILGETGLCRVDYIGPPDIFKFSTIETDVGCELPNTIVKVGDKTFWWSLRGFRMSQGGASLPIGFGKVDKWFSNQVNRSSSDRISVQVVPDYPVILWSFVSRYSLDGEPDYLLTYNWELKEWTYGNARLSILGTSISPSFTTDDTTNTLPGFVYGVSKTDEFPQLTDTQGASFIFPAALVDGSLARMDQSGSAVAQLETQELPLDPAGMYTMNNFLPVVYGATGLTGRVKVRDRQDNENYRVRENLIRENVSGKISCRVRARYFTIGLNLSGPFKRAIGVDIDARDR